MNKSKLWRRVLPAGVLVCVIAAAFVAGVVTGQNKFGTPKTVLHVVTLRWKADATPEQQKAAIDGIKTMAAKIPGMKNVWLKTLKVQGGTRESPYNAAFVMEFADENALKAYADNPAHKEWEKIYLPLRDESRSHDITNDSSTAKK